MNVEHILIADVINDPDNARKHTQRNLETISESLKEFGQRKPIVLKDNVCIAGNGTLEAARLLGWTHIDITRVPSDWSLIKAKAYALADNRTSELAEWDGDALLMALTDIEAQGLLNATGFSVNEMEDLTKLWGATPDLDSLLDSVGDVTEDDGMVKVGFRVPIDVAEKWYEAVKRGGQETELENICVVIDKLFAELTDNA